MISALKENRIKLRSTEIIFFLAKMVFWGILSTGCARRGVSGALYPKSAYAGLNSRPRILYLEPLDHFDWTPRNRRSWTSSGPEGSSDKWCGLCRGLFSIGIMWWDFQKSFNGGCATIYEITDFDNEKYLILVRRNNNSQIRNLKFTIEAIPNPQAQIPNRQTLPIQIQKMTP